MAVVPSRYPGGISNRAKGHPMGDAPFFDPAKWFVFWDDFYQFTIAAAGVTGWRLDEVNTGTPPVVQEVLGGVIKVVNDNADEDNFNHQWATNTTPHSVFQLTAGKRAYLKAKLKVEDADKDIIYFGLHTVGDDPQGTEPADQFVFRTLRATPTALEAVFGTANDAEVSISLGTVSDDTYMDLTMYYDGKDTVYAWHHTAAGVLVASGQATCTSSAQGDLLPNGVMSIGFGMEALDTGADDLHVDWLGAMIER
jgi:hypothetical protein